MEYFTSHVRSAPTSNFDVVVLRCPDLLHFDPVPLNRLFAEKDAVEAEDMVCRILEDIARRLDVLQQGLEASDFAAMLKPARTPDTLRPAQSPSSPPTSLASAAARSTGSGSPSSCPDWGSLYT